MTYDQSAARVLFRKCVNWRQHSFIHS